MYEKYIFVTGGVVSSLGKGIASASLAALLQSHGYKVRLKKLDPYLNVDPGTMNPHEHGETFVTADGFECDLDIGSYERFTGREANGMDNITSGRLFQNVINKERKGEYLGRTVQIVPHVCNEIKDFIAHGNDEFDFVICEIGGNIMDIESSPFIEAIRQFGNERRRDDIAYIHVTLMPYISAADEYKTKPTQNSVKDLLSLGIQPDILLVRSDSPKAMTWEHRNKISNYCNVHKDNVISAPDVRSVYDVPLAYHAEGLDMQVLKVFNLPGRKNPDLDKWKNIVNVMDNPKQEVNIAVIGKYVETQDAYMSLSDAIRHGGFAHEAKINISWIDSAKVSIHDLTNISGIIIPGGFGDRATDGKIKAIQYARENNIPMLGICFGMQLAMIEFARNVLNIVDASSTEFGETNSPIISLMTEWDNDGITEKRTQIDDVGGTMRLGAYTAVLNKSSRVAEIYGENRVSERHRHRWESNPKYWDDFENNGLIISGRSTDGILAECIEIPDHDWFIGVQFHPEYKSRPFDPHPLFKSFVKACLEEQNASK